MIDLYNFDLVFTKIDTTGKKVGLFWEFLHYKSGSSELATQPMIEPCFEYRVLHIYLPPSWRLPISRLVHQENIYTLLWKALNSVDRLWFFSFQIHLFSLGKRKISKEMALYDQNVSLKKTFIYAQYTTVLPNEWVYSSETYFSSLVSHMPVCRYW